MAQGLPDLLFLRWGGILLADYHIISISLLQNSLARCLQKSHQPIKACTFPSLHLMLHRLPLVFTHAQPSLSVLSTIFSLSVCLIISWTAKLIDITLAFSGSDCNETSHTSINISQVLGLIGDHLVPNQFKFSCTTLSSVALLWNK